VERDERDLAGPVPLAVAVESASEASEGEEGGASEPAEGSTGPEGQMRLVVVGDSDLATNTQLQNVPNATFLANALNWLVERETLVGIPPKQPEQVKLSLTSTQLSRLTWLVLIILPGLVILAGLTVYLRRRR
jgi:ABC-type uncharacterized transport system involved in gliding motility auxiliary subunit